MRLPHWLQNRWLMPALKLLIFALLAWGVHATIAKAIDDLRGQTWRLDFRWLIAAGAFYLLGMLPAGLFWRHCLRTMGQQAGVGEALRAYFIGHLGKYVPGKALVVILRTGLIRSHRVDTSLAAISVFFETLTMMTAGSLTALVILAIWYPDQTTLLLLSGGLTLVVGLPTLPPVFRRAVRFTTRGKLNATATAQLDQLGFGALGVGLVAMAIGWLLMGLSLWAALRGIDLPESANAPLTLLPQYMASIALAVVAGFLSMIPGGLGVRDLVLTRLMVPQFGAAAAFGSAVLLRLTWLVAELAISAILYGFKPRPADPRALNSSASGSSDNGGESDTIISQPALSEKQP